MTTSLHTEGAPAATLPAEIFSRGPTESLSAQVARKLVLPFAGPLDSAAAPLQTALGRVLARDVVSSADSPAADLSAVDGFAVADEAPLRVGARLSIVGEAAAGRPFTGALLPGQAVRIFTGALLPAGALRVLKSECTQFSDGFVEVLEVDREPHVRRRAENYRAGDVLLPAGSTLDPIGVALAASAGATCVDVHRLPRIAHLVTGSELTRAGSELAPGQIHDANGPLIASLVVQSGATLVEQRIVGDDLEACRKTVSAMPLHDVLLISGGAGEGRYDFALPLLNALGFEVHFRSVNMRPGKPLGFATRGAQLAFALPGNPVSHWATWQLLIAPALRRLAGAQVDPAIPLRRGVLESAWNSAADHRPVFWPARAEWRGHEWQVQPCRFLNSGDLAGVVHANALLHAAGGASLPVGAPVEFVPCA